MKGVDTSELEEGKEHTVKGTSELFDDLQVKLKNA